MSQCRWSTWTDGSDEQMVKEKKKKESYICFDFYFFADSLNPRLFMFIHANFICWPEITRKKLVWGQFISTKVAKEKIKIVLQA